MDTADTADSVEVVVAHRARATVRVGDVFLKVDSDQRNIDGEAAVIDLVPVPTPRILWRQPNVLALSAVPGAALGVLGEPSPAAPAAWRAAGAATRLLHEAPPPGWDCHSLLGIRERLEAECALLLDGVLVPPRVVRRNRDIARDALDAAATRSPVFVHGDLQLTHVFTVDDQVSGIIDWSEAGLGDALFDLATLTLGHGEHLDDVLAGYGPGVDPDEVRAWWSLRSLVAIRWLDEHGFDVRIPGAERDVLLAQM